MSYYREQLETWLKGISVKADRVLDLGGAANPVIKRVKKFEADEYICFDLGVEEPKMEYIKFDINLPLEQLKGYDDKSFRFDCLFCLEVFEYVWNPVEAMRNIYRLLCNDAVAYISFPAIYPVHNPMEVDYLRYTREGISKLLEETGFVESFVTPRTATKGRDSLASFYSLEGMHPVRHNDIIYDIGYMFRTYKAEGLKGGEKE